MNGLCFAGKKGHVNTLQCVTVTPMNVKSAHWVTAEQIGVLLCTCRHHDLSYLGFCGGNFGHGHPKPTEVLVRLVPGLDVGCRLCRQHGHQLGWGGHWDLVVVLSRNHSIILLFNVYIIPVNLMMRNLMGTFLQGLTPGLQWSTFGPLHASSVSPGSELFVQLSALFW